LFFAFTHTLVLPAVFGLSLFITLVPRQIYFHELAGTGRAVIISSFVALSLVPAFNRQISPLAIKNKKTYFCCLEQLLRGYKIALVWSVKSLLGWFLLSLVSASAQPVVYTGN